MRAHRRVSKIPIRFLPTGCMQGVGTIDLLRSVSHQLQIFILNTKHHRSDGHEAFLAWLLGNGAKPKSYNKYQRADKRADFSDRDIDTRFHFLRVSSAMPTPQPRFYTSFSFCCLYSNLDMTPDAFVVLGVGGKLWPFRKR